MIKYKKLKKKNNYFPKLLFLIFQLKKLYLNKNL